MAEGDTVALLLFLASLSLVAGMVVAWASISGCARMARGVVAELVKGPVAAYPSVECPGCGAAAPHIRAWAARFIGEHMHGGEHVSETLEIQCVWV